MGKLNNDLSIDELEAVTGGTYNRADSPAYHPTYRTPGGNPSSPLFGNGSYHDTIDNVDGLP
jgi:hypothetical protein